MSHVQTGAGSAGAGPGATNREWVRGGGAAETRPRARSTEAPEGARPLAGGLLLALCGRGTRRAMYLVSLFACASSLALSAALPDPALAEVDPPETLHAPCVSVERAREAGRIAREHPVPRPTLLERQPAGEGPIYASQGPSPGSPTTFEDLQKPDADKAEEFAEIGQPNGGSSPGSPPITFEDLDGPPPADIPTSTQPENLATTEAFPPTARPSPEPSPELSPAPESSGDDDYARSLPPSAKPGPGGGVVPTPELVPEGDYEEPPVSEQTPPEETPPDPSPPEQTPPENATDEEFALVPQETASPSPADPPVAEEEPPPAEEFSPSGWTHGQAQQERSLPRDTSGEVPPQSSEEVPEEPPAIETPAGTTDEDEGPTGGHYDAEDPATSDGPDQATDEQTIPGPTAGQDGDEAAGGETTPGGEDARDAAGEVPIGEGTLREQSHEQQSAPNAPTPPGEDAGPGGDQHAADPGDAPDQDAPDKSPTAGETPPTRDPAPDAPDQDAPDDNTSDENAPDQDANDQEPPERSGPGETASGEGPDVAEPAKGSAGGGKDRPVPENGGRGLRRQLDDVLDRAREGAISKDMRGEEGAATVHEERFLRALDEADAAVEEARSLTSRATGSSQARSRARDRARSAVERARRAVDRAGRRGPGGGPGGEAGGEAGGENAPEGLTPATHEPDGQTPPADTPTSDTPTPSTTTNEPGEPPAEAEDARGPKGADEGEDRPGSEDLRPTVEPPITDPGIKLKDPEPPKPASPGEDEPDHGDDKESRREENGG